MQAEKNLVRLSPTFARCQFQALCTGTLSTYFVFYILYNNQCLLLKQIVLKFSQAFLWEWSECEIVCTGNYHEWVSSEKMQKNSLCWAMLLYNGLPVATQGLNSTPDKITPHPVFWTRIYSFMNSTIFRSKEYTRSKKPFHQLSTNYFKTMVLSRFGICSQLSYSVQFLCL